MDLANFQQEKTFSSLYLVEQINLFREQEGNRAVLKHYSLTEKIEREFKEEIAAQIILVSSYKDLSGKQSKCYELNFEQSLQMLMSESKTVRKQVVQILKAQQAKIEAFKLPNFLDPAEAAIAWATEFKAKQLAEAKVAEQAPKVQAFERVIDSKTTYTLDTVSDTIDIGRTKLSQKLKDIGWAIKNSSKGTASTRKAEEAGYAKTHFEYITINEKEVKVKKIVITKRGLDYLINNYDKLLN